MQENEPVPTPSPYDDDRPPPVPLERCFVFFDGGLRANANGRQRFGDRFRRAGFDIDKIRTFDELEAALKGSWHIVLSDMERELDRRAPGMDPLDVKAWRAFLAGDYSTFEVLSRKAARRRNLGLTLVKEKAP